MLHVLRLYVRFQILPFPEIAVLKFPSEQLSGPQIIVSRLKGSDVIARTSQFFAVFLKISVKCVIYVFYQHVESVAIE